MWKLICEVLLVPVVLAVAILSAGLLILEHLFDALIEESND
jgi:hypothetical protein